MHEIVTIRLPALPLTGSGPTRQNTAAGSRPVGSGPAAAGKNKYETHHRPH